MSAEPLHPNAWTKLEIEELRAAYENAECGEDIGLAALAERFGRHKTNISRKARELGLTDISRRLKRERKVRVPKVGRKGSEELRDHYSRIGKERIEKNGHPRGFLGKKHKAEARKIIGEKSAAVWASMTDGERAAHTLKGLKARLANQGTLAPQVARGTWKAGWREIGGKRHYFRSRWEANYARWLQFLKENGEIVDWQYEPVTFWFEKIQRGTRSYKPDFRVIGGFTSAEVTWHEIKGWMDARSRTTLKRMAKYHPGEVIILVRERQMKALARNYASHIEGWE